MKSAVQKHLQDLTPNDIVINCAGETRLGMHKEDYSNRYQIFNLSCICASIAQEMNVKKYIEISTAFVYKSSSNKQNESNQAEPQNIIAKNKHRVEQYIQENLKSLNYTILRPSIVYGCGDTGNIMKRLVISRTYSYMKDIQKLLWSGGLKISLVHINDLCDAILEIIQEPTKTYQKTYNISQPQVSTFDQVYQCLSKVTKSNYQFLGSLMSYIAQKFGLDSALEEINKKHLAAYDKIEQQLQIDQELPFQIVLYDEEIEKYELNIDGSLITQEINFKYKFSSFDEKQVEDMIKESLENDLLPKQLFE